MELHELTIEQASKGLEKGDFSSADLARASLDRIRQTDRAVQAFITVDEKGALEQAAEADARIKNGKRMGPLHGVPVSAKDVIVTKGLRTTAASKMLSDYIPPYDATAISRLRDAGAVVMGKNNCDAFAHGASTEHSAFFTTNNPWDLARVPGGSSGGSAAAVAARQVPASLGTDTGGSVRHPASFCGVTGLKPTYGRVSRSGLISMASSNDCIGMLARTARDAALVLQAMAGQDELDSTSAPNEVPDYLGFIEKHASLEGVRIGIPQEYFGEGLNEDVRKAIEQAIEKLSELGASIQNVTLPHTEYAIAAYHVITSSEISSNLARLDGIRYGYSVLQDKEIKDTAETLYDLYAKNRRYGFGDEAKRRVMIGTYALSSGYYDAYYLKAAKVRALIAQDFEQALAGTDALLAPVTPHMAFKLGEKANDPLAIYLEDVYSSAANLAGIPAISVPCGFARPKDGKVDMPIGMQIMGAEFDEPTILAIAAAYQVATDWHEKMPSVGGAGQP